MYEIICIISGDLTESDAAVAIAEVQEKLRTLGVTIDEVVPLSKQRIAYPIRHIRFGYFYALYCSIGATDIQKVQQELDRHMGLLRTFVRRFDPAQQKKACVEDFAVKMTVPATVVAAPREAAPIVLPSFDEVRTVPAVPLVQQEVIAKSVSAEEIDKKLDELLESDLVPSESI
ncbi:MAG: 30S ribosomal protein S6 [Candidatus Magasanikbacteria bacterium]|nr:30S ribosomal protein S6 [Candidatus Magasanikbacteria bacterium]